MECAVAGFQYHEGETRWGDLRVGQALELVREPGNHHDARAVRVHWHDAILGYVPREGNFAVAQMLDRGERVEGRICLLRESADPWQRVMMQLVLQASPARAVPALAERAAHPAPASRKAAPKPANGIAIPLESLLKADLEAWLAAKEAIKRAK
jgi:hypothetical protein